MSKPTTAVTTAPTPIKGGLLATFASRYNVAAEKVLNVLKQTCFRTEKPASDEQMQALLIVANEYKLNPFTKEIFAFEDKYKGIVPVVSVDGWLRIINEHSQLQAIEFEYAADGAWIDCIIERKDRTKPTRIREFLSECKRNTGPWQSHPQRMLRHKALIQAARVAFGFAGIYDQDEAERIVEVNVTPTSTTTKPTTARPQARVVEAPIDVPSESHVATDDEVSADELAAMRAADAAIAQDEGEAGTRG